MDTNFLHSYCERMGEATLWAEPLNALSNVAFLLAALLAWRDCRFLTLRQNWDCYLLCVILFCIGLGSGAWHIYPNALTVALDVIPITLFINIYLAAFVWRAFHLSWWQVVLTILALQLLNILAGVFFSADTLHGTMMYLPTYAMLLAIVAISWWKGKPFWQELAFTTAFWTLSLIFRTIDKEICFALPIGTHYFWHILNALVLYRLLSLLTRLTQMRN
jgi:hypothetical protein